MSIEELKKALFKAKKLIISVRVRPGSAKSEILGFMADASLKVALKALPEDGQANNALIKLLAQTLSVAPENITIIAGTASRRKKLKIILD